jgi:hypothetical protein
VPENHTSKICFFSGLAGLNPAKPSFFPAKQRSAESNYESHNPSDTVFFDIRLCWRGRGKSKFSPAPVEGSRIFAPRISVPKDAGAMPVV